MEDKNRIPRVGFSKILYLTDLSEAGRYAFPFAASLAHKFGAEMTVFHVEEKHDFEKYLVGYIDEGLWEEIKSRNLQDAREILVHRKRNDAVVRDSVDRFCQETMAAEKEEPYVSYDIAVDVGDPVEKIMEKVKQENYDLIVVGKHGHGVIEGTLMGDTARRVVRRCTVPVLVVQLPDSDDAD
jgi:nucleotide-binding universal stress UspA family protein